MQGHGNSPGPVGYIGKRHEILSDIDTLINIASVHCPDSPIFLFGQFHGEALWLFTIGSERIIRALLRIL